MLENIPDPSQRIELVLKIAKLARYVACWAVNIELLSRFGKSGNASILRELHGSGPVMEGELGMIDNHATMAEFVVPESDVQAHMRGN